MAIGWVIAKTLSWYWAGFPACAGAFNQWREMESTSISCCFTRQDTGKLAVFVGLDAACRTPCDSMILERVPAPVHANYSRFAFGHRLGVALDRPICSACRSRLVHFVQACCSMNPSSATRQQRTRCRCAMRLPCSSSYRSACYSPAILIEQPLQVVATFLIITVGKPLVAMLVVRLFGIQALH